jgi:hypothetical protein
VPITIKAHSRRGEFISSHLRATLKVSARLFRALTHHPAAL